MKAAGVVLQHCRGRVAGRRWCAPALAGLAWAMLPATVPGIAAAEAIHRIETRLERDFGQVMGDTVRQTVQVETEPGYGLEEGLLPQPGAAVNDWLEVREVRWQRASRDAGGKVDIVLTYQIFKGVRGPELLAIPELPLRFRRGEDVVAIQTPAQAVVLNPLIPATTPDEAVAIRDLQAPAAMPEGGHGRRLAGLLAGWVVLLLYAGWRLRLPPFSSPAARPFAYALRELKRLRRVPPSPQSYRQGLRLLHGAINRYARRTVLESQLPWLFREFPELSALQDELERFFAASHRAFFTEWEGGIPADFPLSRLEALCRRCRGIERGRR